VSLPLLHDWALSPDAYKVRLGAALMGVEIARRGVDVFPGRETATRAYRAMNPMGSVPTLVDHGVTLTTAEGALMHLARRAGGGWLPEDPDEQAQAVDWMTWGARALAPALAAREAAMLLLPSPFVDAAGQALAAFRVLEEHLTLRGFEGRGFVVGDGPTVADVALFPPVALAVDFGCVLEDFPALRLWTRRIRGLRGFIAMPGVPEFL
jgi:glutathione S-transferase